MLAISPSKQAGPTPDAISGGTPARGFTLPFLLESCKVSPYPQTYHDEYNTVFDQSYFDAQKPPGTEKSSYDQFNILAQAPVVSTIDVPIEKLKATKFDAGKTDWAILPIGASEEIIKVFEFGAKKYSRGNFLEGGGLAYVRVLNSTLRHIYSFMRGQDLDPESGLSHLAHAGCNIYMLLTYELSKPKNTVRNNDDRAKNTLV